MQEFLENSLGEEGLKRCVVIVSTGDDAPLLRVRAAKVACTVAEYFRDRGQERAADDGLAHAPVPGAAPDRPGRARAAGDQGLSAQRLRAAARRSSSARARPPAGSITGFYTVLVEGDDFNEPIPDAVKGITDGHLWLSRALANRGHFPAIDVLQSISRVRGDVVDEGPRPRGPAGARALRASTRRSKTW